MTVTFVGSFLNMNLLQMSQNSKLLNPTKKAMIKQCKYSWKTLACPNALGTPVSES